MIIEKAWKELLTDLGYDTANGHLLDTPRRVSKFMKQWHTVGAEPPILTTFANDGTDEMVAVGGITFYSMCAHHGLPFYGTASVGYIPGERIVGLSKLARVVDHFARRFQVQEQITRDVAAYLEQELKPRGIGVVVRAEHLCMSMRGIQKPGHQTITSDMRGAFRDRPEARAELLALLQK